MAGNSSSSCSELCALVLVLVFVVNMSSAVNYQVTFPFEEESSKWTYIGNVSNAPRFWDGVPSLDRNSLVFGFLTQTNLKSMLSIHDQTGALYTTVVIDREQVEGCGVPAPCTLNFDVAARSTRPESSYFEIISVTIVIEDINDNAPEFPNSIQYLNISESSTNGSAFIIDSAVDYDRGGNNSIQHYELYGHNDKFALNASKKLDGSFTVKLVVIRKLDREAQDKYVVRVVARDGGSPVQSGMTEIHISVIDVNDNPPVLEQAMYNITIKEDIDVGNGILQISATDMDIGKNGEITYRFSPYQPGLQEIQELFAIEGDTGILRVVGNIVYEPGKTYGIIVEAIDGGSPPLISVNQAIVNINILDTGNTKPTVEINILNGVSKVANVSENAGRGTFVAHVYVSDPDTGDNGKITCTVPNQYFGIQNMSRKGYFKVVVEGHLDREQQESHSVLVHCRDHGVPVLTATASFLVRVTDENDNTPVFSEKRYVQYLYENNKRTDVVLTVVAHDQDLDRNGDVYYYLGDEVGNRMVIDPNTGVITANFIYDREVRQKETFTVYAEDKGRPSSRVGNATVVIHISDRNDNAPKFSKSIFEFSIRENMIAGTPVANLTAVDKDEGENAAFTYSFTNTTDPNMPFVVFPNGQIKSKQMLDREIKGTYEFMVMAVDKGSPRKTGLAMVIIEVKDVNDKEPVIRFPTDNNKTVSISHLEKAGTFITQVEATDDDAGVNKRLTYVIAAGNEKRIFSMDLDTGELFLSREYLVEHDETFPLIISVHDGGVPQHSVRGELDVIIRYSNVTTPTVPVDTTANNNKAIVGVVVAVTLLLSVAIIVVICVIRRFDRAPSKSSAQNEKMQNNMSEMKEKNFQNGTIISQPYDKIELPRKKKEVSFSFEDDLEGMDHEISFGNTSVFTEGQNEHSMTERQPGQFKTFQLHQTLLGGAPPPAWNQQHKTHEVKLNGNPDDSHSETSRETVNSDSGKGGSEEDLPISHSFKDDIKDSSFPLKNSSNVMRCSVPKDRRGVSSERTRSVLIDERNQCNSSMDKSKRQSFPSSMNEKPKFSVMKPYKEKEIRENKAQTESWVPSYV